MSKFFELTDKQREPLYKNQDFMLFKEVGTCCISKDKVITRCISKDVTVEQLEIYLNAKYIGFMDYIGHSFLLNNGK